MASSARIDELRKKFDENPRRYFAPLANEYRKAGDLSQAIFICQEYLPQQPGHMSGHIVYGQALYEMGRQEEAQVVFETALALDPENLIALRHLGDIARQANDYDAARNWYQRVLEADPRNEEIAQIMLSLLHEPASQADGQEADAVSAGEAAAPTPISSPAVSHAPALDDAPAGAPPATGAASRAEESPEERFRYLTPRASTAVPPSFSAASDAEPAGAQWQATAPEEELLDLSDFSIGGPDAPAEDADGVAPGHASFTHAESSDTFGEAAGSESELPPAPSFGETPLRAPEAETAETWTGEDGDLAVSFRDEATASFSGTESTSAAPDLSSDPLLADDDFELMSPAVRFAGAVESGGAPTDLPQAGTDESPNDSGEGRLHQHESLEVQHDEAFEPLEVRPFEPDPLAIAAVTPLDTVEVGAGLELDSPGSNTPTAFDGFSTFDTDNGSAPAPDSTAADASRRIEPVDLASPIDFLGAEAPSAAADADPDESFAEGFVAESASFSDASDPAADTTGASFGAESDAAADATAESFSNTGFDSPTASPVDATAAPHAGSTVDHAAIDALFNDGSEQPTDDAAGAAPEESPAQPAEAFVTETMAELYLQQGHLDSALGIYQRLMDQRPDDHALRERARAVEARVHGIPETVAAEEPAMPMYGGPTIGEFLRGLAAMRPSTRSDDETGAFDAASQPMASDERDSSENADGIEPVAAAAGSEAEVRSSFDALFADASHDTTMDSESVTASAAEAAFQSPDEAEYATLGAVGENEDVAQDGPSSDETHDATAMAQASTPVPLHGLPAHRATSELSLDHVFKSDAPAHAPSDGFSLDRFFADDAIGGEPKSSAEGRVPPAAPDDIAQFNAWLNGLKKT